MSRKPPPSLRLESRVERLEDGSGYLVVPVWEDVARQLLEAGHRRVVIEVDGRTYRRALGGPEMGRFLIFGKAARRELGWRLGDEVVLNLRSDPDPDAVDVPEELIEALAADDEARARWETFTPGRQRSLAHYVSGAKRSETRCRRAVELVEKIRTHTLYGD